MTPGSSHRSARDRSPPPIDSAAEPSETQDETRSKTRVPYISPATIPWLRPLQAYSLRCRYTLRKDQFDRVRLFACQKRYAAHGGKESLRLEGDPFFRLMRNHLAIIGVIPFDQLGNEQGPVQLILFSFKDNKLTWWRRMADA